MNQPISTEPNRQKARSLEDILLEFKPIEQVFYDPFQVEPKRVATAVLPPTFSTRRPHPYDYFTLVFTPNLFHLITTNTNKYATIQRIHVEHGQREWSNMLIEELYVFISAIICMGVYEEP